MDSQLPEGSWIGQLNAKDEDFTDLVSGLTYRATMGDAVGLVNVTRDGKLILNPGVRLEPGRNYSMIIEASDAGKKVVCFLSDLYHTIFIDIYRLTPQFNFKYSTHLDLVSQNLQKRLKLYKCPLKNGFQKKKQIK